jgi:DNA-binding NarL/FixJ family response regulator
MPTGRILIVDNNRRDALDLQQRVTQVGHTVVGLAASSREALTLAALLRPDVVLIDIHLPGPVDGIQLGTRLWARFSVSVIYVSAHFAEHALQPLWPTCMAGLLGKDAGARDLQRARKQVLEHRAPCPSAPEGRRRWPPPTFGSPS